MRGNLQQSNLVVEEPPHGEPVQCLIASPADAAVVHVSGHCHTQPLLTAPEENDNVNLVQRTRAIDCVAAPQERYEMRKRSRRGPVSPGLMTLLCTMNGND